MIDLGSLSDKARSAAMRGGTQLWGEWGSATHVRYSEKIPKDGFWRRRRMCICGCRKKVTHAGMANGVGLMSGCELTVARWVRDGYRRKE